LLAGACTPAALQRRSQPHTHPQPHTPPAGRVDARTGKVAAVPLSSDHTPMDPAEADRVLASGVSLCAGILMGDR
jgi:hypothetical protein